MYCERASERKIFKMSFKENLDPKKSNNSGESESNDNSQRSKITLSQKTDYIIERLKKILFQNGDINIGAFFLVEYNSSTTEPYFLAYNKGKSNGTIESIMDMLAEELKIDPVELRLKNILMLKYYSSIFGTFLMDY